MDVRTLCLGVLSLGDATGYDIKQALEDLFRPFYNASYGSIYPALAGLAKDGAIEGLDAGDRRFPERKRYRLTEAGWQQLRAAVGRANGHETLRSEFLLAMFFSHLLSADDLYRIVNEKITESRSYISLLGAYGRSSMTEGQRFAVRYALAMSRASIDFLEGEGKAIVAAQARDLTSAESAKVGPASIR